MADSETVDTTQQVTSQTPATKQKNPKRVAAGKAIAERTKQAREAQKRALAEAQVIIANNRLKQAEPPAVANNRLKQAEPPATDETKVVDSEGAKNVLTTTQWLCIISIVVSLAGIYYKCEEIKSVLTPKKPQASAPPPVLPNMPVDVAPKRGLKMMD